MWTRGKSNSGARSGTALMSLFISPSWSIRFPLTSRQSPRVPIPSPLFLEYPREKRRQVRGPIRLGHGCAEAVPGEIRHDAVVVVAAGHYEPGIGVQGQD